MVAAIIYPLKAQYISTRNRSRNIIIAIWIVAFTSSIPIILIASHAFTIHTVTGTEVAVCNLPTHDSLWKKGYFYAVFVLFFAVPFFVLAGVYSLISLHLIRDRNKSHGMAEIGISKANMRARRQVVAMLFTVVSSCSYGAMYSKSSE